MDTGKKVLAVYYTQSGQMGEIMDRFTSPFTEAGASVEKVRVTPTDHFPFPWTGKRFFSVMPDCVLGIPHKLDPFVLQETKYDLVIFAWQPWFLSPSIAANALMHEEVFKAVVKDTPVVTISAARNMWLSAFMRIHKTLLELDARHVGNVALVDRHANPVSFVTIFYWMLSGKKERYLNLFPKPGISETDINKTAVYGRITTEHLMSNNWEGMQQRLLDENAAHINYPLMVIEGKARYIFAAWARFIAKRKNPAPWVTAFKYYLFAALFLGAPILLTLDAVFLKPFTAKKIKERKEQFLLLK
jgi:hypothetical protein